MSVNYNLATINDRLNVVVTDIGAAGFLRILTAGGVTLSTIPLATPCGTVAGGILTFTTPITDPATVAAGTAARAQIETSGGTAIVTGLTVGNSSAFDIVMANTAILAGRSLALTSGTITGV